MRFLIIALAVLASACQPLPPRSTEPADLARLDPSSSCGRCHAVGRLGDSPNPNAPPFAAIVNQPNLTAGTLSSWLRDAHNYPSEMAFSLSDEQIEELVRYMLTLQEPAYRPAI
jgi:mono/diheme cytochrome c family protein